MGIAEDMLRDAAKEHHMIHKPKHYTSHPSGVECIDITKHMSFTLGNVIKYVWRADLKGDAIEDLRKAREYLDIEIAKRESTTKLPAGSTEGLI